MLEAIKAVNEAHQLQLQRICENQNISALEKCQRQIQVVSHWQVMTERFQNCVRLTGVGERTQPPSLEADKDQDNVSDGEIDK